MKLIKLTQGKFAQVDDEDFKTLNKVKWRALKSGKNTYAYRMRYDTKRLYGVLMHRFLMGLTGVDKDKKVDHIDHNPLNNQKCNLRICTSSQNNRNRTASKNKTSKYLGVSFRKNDGRWQSEITSNYKYKRIGCYKTEQEAALAYNRAAIEIHGEFANLNIIENI